MILTIACRTVLQTKRAGIPRSEESLYPTHGTRVAGAPPQCYVYIPKTKVIRLSLKVPLLQLQASITLRRATKEAGQLRMAIQVIFSENTLNDSDKGNLKHPRIKSFMSRLNTARLTFHSRGERSPGTRNSHSKICSPASPQDPSPETCSADTCDCHGSNAAHRTKILPQPADLGVITGSWADP